MRQFLRDCWAIAVLTPFVCVGALPLRPDSLDIRKQISNEQPPAPNRTGTGAVLQQLLVNLNHTNGTLMAEFNNLVQENAGAVDDAAKLIRVNAHIVGGAVSQAILLGGAKLKRGDVSGAIQAVDESIVEARQKAAEANRSFRSAAWSAACVLMLFVAVGACWGVEHLLTLRGEKDPNVGVPRTEQDQDQYHHFPALGVLRFVLSGMVLLYNFYPWSTQEVKSLSSASPTPDAQLRGAIQRRATQKPDLSQCGVLGLSQDDGSRIMHGKSAARCTWRWQVSLHDVRKNTTKSSHFCGGTLIDGKWVLTAAHCVGSFSQCDLRFVRVIAGAWKHNSESRLREGTSAERGVVRVHKHPRYGHAAPSDYDFALVELDEQLPMNECIGIACLPEADRSDGDQARWAQQCSITGWGASKDAGDAPSTLQEGSVSTLSQQDCIKDYAAHNATITAAMLCASGKSDAGITDACYGDSGGPLVCKENDRYVVRGITSWGLGCASEKFPGVYSRVTAALEWIRDTMAGKNSALADPVDFHGAMWTITSGPCTMDASRPSCRHPLDAFKLGSSCRSDVLHPQRLLPELLQADGAEGLLGAAWATDEFCLHQVGQRTARTVQTGVYLLWQYKVCWTPETSNDIHAKVAKRLVECLRRNEGLYVKFGQAMSTMDVILPEEYKSELKTLHDQAATFEFKEVRRVVESQLGQSLSEVFSEFEETPIASASIAQVHRAQLRPEFAEGHEGNDSLAVAVKIQKPNIPAQNRCDLAVYKLVLTVLEYAFDLPMVWTYGYTRQQLEAELDFRIEARHARQAAEELDACSQFRGKVIVPAVQGKVSGEHVLVMEWVDSLGPASDSNALKKAGLRPVDVMRTATEVFGYQIFSTGHVHCDPHPGNLLVRLAPAESSEKWQLVLLDHGLYCELNPALRRDYADFWVAAALGDTASTVRICSQWGIADQDAAELFASLTQFRRVRLGAQRLDAMASLFGSRGNKKADVMPHAPKKLTAKAMAEAQQKLKARAKKVLGDTAAFPRELLFVGRSLNMIRSANFALGTAVNRVAILAECAAAGAALQGGSLASRRMAVWNFHFRVQSLLFLSKLFQLWQSLSSLGLAPALLGLTGLFLRLSQQKPWSHAAFPARRPEAEVTAGEHSAVDLAGFCTSAALDEDMLSAMVARIMAWYPSYVITLIFLCVVFFSYSAWDWTSFLAHVFLISGSFQEHREAAFPYLPCSWWFTCLAAYTLAWLPMHNILRLSSDSVIWTMFVMATAVVIPSVLLEWLFFKDMAIFEMFQYSFAFFYGQALAVWQVNHCMLLQVQTAAPSRQLRILQIA
ncbi:ABC1 family protein C10F6.14c [Symbiodinium microadriaticum]|uniref:ABC1 family protein C10F6.14c n=1 Tax=Symbiodinium microadriaticum TaxID=2951 RepID=A0A1Q9EI48_SYMMI|nr:ABC1 family protein C10F6.14c [Symbiodinium microadriaticum]